MLGMETPGDFSHQCTPQVLASFQGRSSEIKPLWAGTGHLGKMDKRQEEILDLMLASEQTFQTGFRSLLLKNKTNKQPNNFNTRWVSLDCLLQTLQYLQGGSL